MVCPHLERSSKGLFAFDAMKKTDIWMPVFIGDYLADTTRLTTIQHGAYFLLMMDYWRSGAPPDDDQVLSSICRCSADQWKPIRAALQGFFKVSDGLWAHSRIDRERERATENSKQRSESGKVGAAKRWQDDSKAMANAMANGWQNDGTSPSPSPLPLTPALASPTENPFPAPDKPDAKKEPNPLNLETWKAYKEAYLIRYGVEPVRNAGVNAKIKGFVARLGFESPNVAAHYVRSSTGFYVRDKHGVGLMLRDAEGLRTEWATGNTVTHTQALQSDQTAARGNVWGKLIREAEERERNEAIN